MTAKPRTTLALTDGAETCRQYVVTLDGKVQKLCTFVDSEAGYVMRYKTVFGVPVRDRRGQAVVERVNGVVTITPKGAS